MFLLVLAVHVPVQVACSCVSVTLSVTAVRIIAWVIRESAYIRRSAFVRFFTEIPNTSS